MNFTIVSPSYQRADIARVQKYLPACTYLVGENERRAYEKAGHRVITCPTKVQGNVCRVRNWILDNLNPVLMLDDDVSAFHRWEDRDLKKLSADEAYKFIEHAFNLARELNARLWGMNLLVDKGAYREHTPFSFRSVILGPCSGHINNECRYDESLSLKDDYDMSIQVLNRYRRALRFNAYVYTTDHYGLEGGCAAYRTVARDQNQFRLLQKKWGSKIVKADRGEKVYATKKKTVDINPIISVPIRGV